MSSLLLGPKPLEFGVFLGAQFSKTEESRNRGFAQFSFFQNQSNFQLFDVSRALIINN